MFCWIIQYPGLNLIIEGLEFRNKLSTFYKLQHFPPFQLLNRLRSQAAVVTTSNPAKSASWLFNLISKTSSSHVSTVFLRYFARKTETLWRVRPLRVRGPSRPFIFCIDTTLRDLINIPMLPTAPRGILQPCWRSTRTRSCHLLFPR